MKELTYLQGRNGHTQALHAEYLWKTNMVAVDMKIYRWWSHNISQHRCWYANFELAWMWIYKHGKGSLQDLRFISLVFEIGKSEWDKLTTDFEGEVIQEVICGAFNRFTDFFVQAFKIVVDSWKFSILLLYILWGDWPIFMISASYEQLQQELEYTLLNH